MTVNSPKGGLGLYRGMHFPQKYLVFALRQLLVCAEAKIMLNCATFVSWIIALWLTYWIEILGCKHVQKGGAVQFAQVWLVMYNCRN